jgi:hypothetical protein
MSIFNASKMEQAYLKMGIYGIAGSGKTFTSTLVAIGLHAYIKSTKPVFFFDTESGSDFVRSRFADAGINLQVAKSRAFSDLLEGVKEAEAGSDIFVLDSVTHVWNELIDAFMKKNGLIRLALKHWQPLKSMWREFSERFVNSRLHIVVCGRSADVWDEVQDEDGSKEIRKVGTKMKTENELSYEPSLLCEMTAIQLSPHFGGKLVRHAFVKKDRFDILDGTTIENPTFESFLPHIERLNLGGEHKAIEAGRDSQGIFNNDNLGERRIVRKEILLEKITNEIRKLHPGQTEKDKTSRIALMEEVFKTNSWTEISTFLKPEALEQGLETLIAKVTEVTSPQPQPEPEKPVKPTKKGGK